MVNGNEALGDDKNCNVTAFDEINVILKAKINIVFSKKLCDRIKTSFSCPIILRYKHIYYDATVKIRSETSEAAS